MVEVNSETDFVARNDQFQGLVKMIADVALSVGADVEKIKAAKAGSITVERCINDTIAKIGENMTLRRAGVLSVGKGAIGILCAQRDHRRPRQDRRDRRRSNRPARPMSWPRSDGRSRCMSPPPIRWRSMPAGVRPAVVEREKDVLADKFKQQGKPANVIEKIVESGLKTFYKEVCLLEQPFIHRRQEDVSRRR